MLVAVRELATAGIVSVERSSGQKITLRTRSTAGHYVILSDDEGYGGGPLVQRGIGDASVATTPITNLVPNPSAESDLSYIGGPFAAGPVTRVPDGASGHFAAEYTATSSTAFGIGIIFGGVTDSTSIINLAGTAASVRVSIKLVADSAPSTGQIQVGIRYLDSSGSLLGSSLSSATPTLNRWYNLTVTGTAPANTAKADV